MMRPVREKMKCLFLSQRDSTDSVKCLLKIGHHIEGLLKKFSGYSLHHASFPVMILFHLIIIMSRDF